MQHVSSHPEEAKEKGKRARRDMIQHYHPTILAKQVVEYLTNTTSRKELKQELR